MKKIKVGILLSFFAINAQAEVIFECLTAQKQRLILEDNGKVISYQFAKPSQKLVTVIQIPRSIARTDQWDGMGRWHDYHVLLNDEKHTMYVFYFGWDGQTGEQHAGLEIYHERQLKSEYICDIDTLKAAKFVDINLVPL